MEAGKNTARSGTGAIVQIRRRERKGSPRGRGKRWRGVGRGCGGLHSQSRCFFLGPMISWVVALHTVLDTAEPVTLCWAAVIRSVRLWPDISAARPPPLPLRSRQGLGPPSGRGSPLPTAPPTPTGSRPACRPGAGLRAARRHPLGEPRLACSPRSPTPSRGHSRSPRLSLSPPLPWSAGARPGKRDRELQENGGARLLLGAFRAAPVSRDSGSAPCSLPPAPSPFPFLSGAPPSLAPAREERGGARALRGGTRPAGATGGPPAGTARPAASRDAPCQQVARGRAPRVVGGLGEGRPATPLFHPEARTSSSEADAVGLTKR